MKSVVIELLYIFSLLFSNGYCKFPDKIIGGNTSSIEEFPSTVSVQSSGLHSCGGSIIDETHILTAAHCVSNEKNIIDIDINILSGTNDQHDFREGLTHEVIIIVVHPEYDTKTFENDIAICTLAEPIKISNLQRPILLATDELPVNTIVTIAGWGFETNGIGANSRYLKKLDMSIIDSNECQRCYGSEIDLSKQICTQRQDERTLSHGDSGSGLIYRDKLIGIVSTGPSGNHIGYPVVHTSVLAYKTWIEKTIKRY